MPGWSDIPYDILLLIFKYLEDFVFEIGRPKNFTKIEIGCLFPCQLTCKSWGFFTKRRMYRDVRLLHMKRLELFTRTLQTSDIGPLVRNIFLHPRLQKKETQPILTKNLGHIATHCTFLKNLHLKSGCYRDTWKFIKEERLKGNFAHLRFIPSLALPKSGHISDYDELVYSLKDSLCEIVVYNNTMLRDEAKLWYFPKVDTAFFKFDFQVDIDNIDFHLKRLPSCTAIDFDIGYHTGEEYQVKTEFSPYVFSQIKKLAVKQPNRFVNFYEHIKEAFPRLKNASISMKKNPNEQMPMTTIETVQFLDYISNVPEFSVDDIPAQNINDILKNLSFTKRHVTSLQLTYTTVLNPLFLMSIKSSSQVKGKIIIDVSSKINEPPMLPPLGFIENSGNDIKYLDVDLGVGNSGAKCIAKRLRHGITLAYILDRCPSLLGICFTNTFFNNIGIHVFQRGVTIPEYLTFKHSEIDASFFPSLSSSVTYISQLLIKNCKFTGEVPKGFTREIVMPDTKLDTITYEEEIQARKVHVKVSKTKHNIVDWYVCDDDEYVSSFAEEEYNRSIKNQQILSIFIQCKNASKIIIRLPTVKTVIKI